MLKLKYFSFSTMHISNKLRPALFIIIPIILLAGLYWFFFAGKYQKTNNAYIKASTVLIKPQVSGYIREIFVSENHLVKSGDIIARIDDAEYLSTLRQAQAHLSSASSKVKSMEYELQLQDYKIQEAEAIVSASKAALVSKEKRFERMKKLIAEGSISQQKYDEADAQYKASKAQWVQNKAMLETVKKNSGLLKLKLEAGHAGLKEARAAVKIAELNLQYTNILAPNTGYLGKSSLRIGQLVTQGEALAYLVPVKDVWVEANFKEVQINKMKRGDRAILYIDAFPKREFYGTVDSISPGSGSIFSILPPENATGNFTKVVQRFPVKIVFDSDQDTTNIRPGMSSVIKVRVH